LSREKGGDEYDEKLGLWKLRRDDGGVSILGAFDLGSLIGISSFRKRIFLETNKKE